MKIYKGTMGGPAFPQTRYAGEVGVVDGGLTVWDWCAANMPSDEAAMGEPGPDGRPTIEQLRWKARLMAIARAEYADAMMIERGKRHDRS